MSALSVRSGLAEHAEGLTEGLAQVLAGAALLADTMQDAGIPQALGLSPGEWAERRLAGQIRLSREERRAVVVDLTERGMSKPQIAEALGVGEATVARDRAVSSDTPAPELTHQPVPIPEDRAVSSDTPAPEPIEDAEILDAEVVGEEGDEPTQDPMAVHYSSKTDEWATPQDFYDVVHAEFEFDLDVCALDSSAKCERYFTPETDGLAQDWTGTVWMNPPYGDVIVDWVRKAYQSAQAGATVVCLVPARTDTAWFHDYCLPGEVRLIRGRLRFGSADASAPFPSCLVVLGPDITPRAYGWSWR